MIENIVSYLTFYFLIVDYKDEDLKPRLITLDEWLKTAQRNFGELKIDRKVFRKSKVIENNLKALKTLFYVSIQVCKFLIRD